MLDFDTNFLFQIFSYSLVVFFADTTDVWSSPSYFAAYHIHYGTAHNTCTAGSYHHHLAPKELDYYFSFLLEQYSLHCWPIHIFLSQPRSVIETLATQHEIFVLWGKLHHDYA